MSRATKSLNFPGAAYVYTFGRRSPEQRIQEVFTMFRELAAPAAVFTSALLFFGVPAAYRHQALGSSSGLLVFLLGLMWVLFRGYRARILGALRPANLLGYLAAFLVLNHAVNFYCFMYIEAPVEFPWLTFDLSWFVPGILVITLIMLKVIAANWFLLGVSLRVMGARYAWSLATKIAIYSLPASLLVALPGADSWRVAIASLALVQLVTLWRLKREGHLTAKRMIDPQLLD
jgi:hypothetical protein